MNQQKFKNVKGLDDNSFTNYESINDLKLLQRQNQIRISEGKALPINYSQGQLQEVIEISETSSEESLAGQTKSLSLLDIKQKLIQIQTHYFNIYPYVRQYANFQHDQQKIELIRENIKQHFIKTQIDQPYNLDLFIDPIDLLVAFSAYNGFFTILRAQTKIVKDSIAISGLQISNGLFLNEECELEQSGDGKLYHDLPTLYLYYGKAKNRENIEIKVANEVRQSKNFLMNISQRKEQTRVKIPCHFYKNNLFIMSFTSKISQKLVNAQNVKVFIK